MSNIHFEADQIVTFRTDIEEYVNNQFRYSECIAHESGKFCHISDPNDAHLLETMDEEAIKSGDIDYKVITTIYNDDEDIAQMTYWVSDALNGEAQANWEEC